jgi:Uma2 family endonuclease
VKEYWLVDLESRSVELYELLGDGLQLVATFSGDDEMTSSVLPGFRLKLTDLFKL